MELPILTSKKGTKVIKSTALHRALELNDGHYAQNVKRWLADVYQFGAEIRRPAAMSDYARAKQDPDSMLKEYYFSLELARLISLNSRSRAKQAVANKLAREEAAYAQKVCLDADQMIDLLERVKAMSRLSCQIKAEQRHAEHYVRRRGSLDYWNHYRAEFIGLRKDDLHCSLNARGITVPRRATLRELLLRYDPDQLIRIGLIDHYAAQGHPLTYAAEIGRIGLHLARQMQLEVCDDRRGETLFSTPVETQLLAAMQGAAAA